MTVYHQQVMWHKSGVKKTSKSIQNVAFHDALNMRLNLHVAILCIVPDISFHLSSML
jgi:hypothetical protein